MVGIKCLSTCTYFSALISADLVVKCEDLNLVSDIFIILSWEKAANSARFVFFLTYSVI